MIVYSERIVRFISEIKLHIRFILIKEMGLKVHRSRFLDSSETMSYPIKVVIFNRKKVVGYFDSDFFELGFHERLMHENKETLLSVIRHELAHYMTYISHGDQIESHGPEFRKTCEKYGWGKEVFLSTVSLNDLSEEIAQGEKRIVNKVQKLMALGSSSSQNEAEAAVLKSQELLLKYNLKESEFKEKERFYLKRILKQKKRECENESNCSDFGNFFCAYCLS